MQIKNISMAEQRVLVAKDVLANLKSQKFDVRCGSYVALKPDDFNVIFNAKRECQLNELLKDKKCRVCAIGGLFISTLNQFNTLKRENIYLHGRYGSISLEDIFYYLKKYFTCEQLGLIEEAFERGEHDNLYRCLLSNRMIKIAIKFGRYYPNPEKRLAAIMRNMIRHSGEFKPELAALR